ncbi:hypothetical protein GC197_14395 [bacterium]|nr:hypothetical protein [bacterium]
MNEFVNKIFHADAHDLLAKLPSESIDAVICDPMYGTAKNYEYEWGFDPMYGTAKNYEYEWGFDPGNANPDRHWEYHQPIYEECRRVLKPNGRLAWAQSPKFCKHFRRWFSDHRLWTLTRFREQGRNVVAHWWVVQTKKQEAVEVPDRDALVTHDKIGRLRDFHPCPKSVEEMKFMVELLTKRGDLVLDWCFGVGSSLLAAEELGRRWIGCDLGESYCRVAKLRMHNLLSHMQAQTREPPDNCVVADRC